MLHANQLKKLSLAVPCNEHMQNFPVTAGERAGPIHGLYRPGVVKRWLKGSTRKARHKYSVYRAIMS